MGEIIISDIYAADWRNLLSVVDRLDMRFKLVEIKGYISDQINYCIKSGDIERRGKFLDSKE